jgi:hypothetical protein
MKHGALRCRANIRASFSPIGLSRHGWPSTVAVTGTSRSPVSDERSPHPKVTSRAPDLLLPRVRNPLQETLTPTQCSWAFRVSTWGNGPALTVSRPSFGCGCGCCLWCQCGTVIRSLVGDGPPVVSCRSATEGPPVRARRRSGHRRSRCRSSRARPPAASPPRRATRLRARPRTFLAEEPLRYSHLRSAFQSANGNVRSSIMPCRTGTSLIYTPSGAAFHE